MTREHKLAIIIGFSIVLVVTIVISDHFSKANTAELVEAGAGVIAPDLPLGREDGAAREKAPVLVQTENGFVPIGEMEPIQSIAAMSEPAGSGVIGSALDSVGTTIVHTFEDIRENGELPALKLDRVITMGEPAERNRPSTNTVTTHTVQENETLWGLAQEYYSDGALHQQLAMYNRHVVGDARTLSVGMRLEIPTRQRLLVGRPAPHANAEASGSSRHTNAVPESQPAKSYTVQSGDTLGEIAQKQCGSVRFVGQIMSLNSAQLDDEDSIRVGMVLYLPAG